MAADNRNFVNTIDNAGTEVLVEDKRLYELTSATAQTAGQISTSTQFIPLQDTDGNIVKINPASFQEAVRNVLAGLLVNNDKGTTFDHVPVIGSSDFGSSTLANLASVLGGISTTRFVGDCNTLTTYGKYQVIGADSTNAAFGSGHTMLVMRVADYVTQIAIDPSDGRLSTRVEVDRTGNSWTAWTLNYDHNLLSNSTELSSLASALGARTTTKYAVSANTNISYFKVCSSTVGQNASSFLINSSRVEGGFLNNILVSYNILSSGANIAIQAKSLLTDDSTKRKLYYVHSGAYVDIYFSINNSYMMCNTFGLLAKKGANELPQADFSVSVVEELPSDAVEVTIE